MFSIIRVAEQIDGQPPLTYKIKLEEISLYVLKVSPTSTCCLAIIDTMKIAPVIKYLIQRIEMHSFLIPGHVTSRTQEHIILGQL